MSVSLKTASLMALAIVASASVSFGQTVASETNAGVDRNNLGGWTFSNAPTIRDNISSNGDNWPFFAGAYIEKSDASNVFTSGATGTTAGIGYVGLTSTSGGEDRTATLTKTSSLTIESYRPVFWSAEVAMIMGVGGTTPYASAFNTTVKIDGVTVDASKKTTVANNAYAGAAEIKVDPAADFTPGVWGTTTVSSNWSTGFTATSGVTPVTVDFRKLPNDPSSTLAKRHAAGIGKIQIVRAASGDANLDRSVNLDDASILIGKFGQNTVNAAGTVAAWQEADFDGNGTVNLDDASGLIGSFGTSYDAISPGTASATVDANGNILLDAKDIAFYKIFVGDANNVAVNGTSILSKDGATFTPAKGVVDLFGPTTKQDEIDGFPNENFGEFTTSNSITTNTDFNIAVSETIDTGVNVNLAALAASGAKLWLQYQLVGNNPVYVNFTPATEEPAIPEPASLGILAVSGLALLVRRRK